MILLLEFDWTKVRNTDPFVSKATIIDTLGATCLVGAELVVTYSLHFMRLKSVMPNQVSSTLMTVVYFPLNAFSRLSANCWRRIRFLGELAFHATGCIF